MQIVLKDHSLDLGAERLVISLLHPLAADSIVTLDVSYSAKLNQQMRGFYRTVQKGPQGERNAASCHFEVSQIGK